VLVSTAYDAAGRVEFASAPTHDATNPAGIGLDGPARNQAFIRQLVLDRRDCRIQVGDLTCEVVVRTGQNVVVGGINGATSG